jgi:hypothetical protein
MNNGNPFGYVDLIIVSSVALALAILTYVITPIFFYNGMDPKWYKDGDITKGFKDRCDPREPDFDPLNITTGLPEDMRPKPPKNPPDGGFISGSVKSPNSDVAKSQPELRKFDSFLNLLSIVLVVISIIFTSLAIFDMVSLLVFFICLHYSIFTVPICLF